MRPLHLVCNAHLDPVWLWELEEGVAETLSTFRVAADFCEEYDGFIFNHNEALLYQWVEQHDPILFARIQKLVREGKWHILGGWYLQPDCNMPSGESFVRQILAGKNYFIDKFGVEPKVGVNFDSFGHSRGLVEILKGTGYEGYLFCRPEPYMLDLPGEDFAWVGFNGSSIACHRAYNSYESDRGEATDKIRGWMEKNPDKAVGLVLWGIGDHGGGPSRIDYQMISDLAKEPNGYTILHSTPENYFEDLKKGPALPEYKGLLNPRYIGCYTSQIRIKQLHRKLENELYGAEKMLAHAYMAGLMAYPGDKLAEITKDLLLMEFHDILPGSSIQPVEDYAISLAGHGLVEIKQLKTQAFLALCAGQEIAGEGEIPILVYNPHPYEVEAVVECEFQLPDQNKDKTKFAKTLVYEEGKLLPCQTEHELSNFNVDWRKRTVFNAKLKPGQTNRYNVKIEIIDNPPAPSLPQSGDYLVFEGRNITVKINTKTGTIDAYEVGGKSYLKAGGCLPLVIADDENSWAHTEKSFRNVKGSFRLMTSDESAEFSGILAGEKPAAVRVIEDGPVRTIVEAVMIYNHSFICMQYYLPKQGTEVKISCRVFWNEKMTMLKLSLPTTLTHTAFIGQTAYGSEQLLTNGDEMCSHKWNVVSGKEGALSVINTGTYGSDCKDGELRVSLLRSPGYSAGKSDFSLRKPFIMEQDRFSPFIDQGERMFEFFLNASAAESRLNKIEREANAKNEQLTALSFFPTGRGEKAKPFALLSDDTINLSVFKKAERDDRFILRLFNPSAETKDTVLTLPAIGKELPVSLKGYGLRSFALSTKDNSVTEVDLMERPL